ncbi:MAG: class I SAM-dependent methyltransferase [Syntrophorhabdus sp.]|nr:class I SAM-dependent methyltransferase [Syntrophorhabdus sp.]
MKAEKKGFARWQEYAARKTAVRVNILVPAELKRGRVLDIGCGFFRNLSTETSFSEKYGLDKGIDRAVRMELKKRHDLALVDVDLEYSARVPFGSDFFEVVAMAAVLDRMEPTRVLRILQEIERVLKPGGVVIITVPARWTRGLLGFLVRVNIIKRTEVREHKAVYTGKHLLAILGQAGFQKSSLTSGHFQFFTGTWVRAKKVHNRFELEELEPLET